MQFYRGSNKDTQAALNSDDQHKALLAKHSCSDDLSYVIRSIIYLPWNNGIFKLLLEGSSLLVKAFPGAAAARGSKPGGSRSQNNQPEYGDSPKFYEIFPEHRGASKFQQYEPNHFACGANNISNGNTFPPYADIVPGTHLLSSTP